MKCWKCGQENSIGSTYCLNCGMSLERTPVKTSVGKAMRELYDKYGCQKVLTENAYLKNGLGDFLEDSNRSRIIRNQVGTVMDVGLGKVYYEQLEKGRPDNAFNMRVRELITRSCGFNDYTANEIMGYFDEMIGWKAAEPSVVPSNKKPSSVPPNNNKKPSSVPPQNHKKTQTVPTTKPTTLNKLLEKANSNLIRKTTRSYEPLSLSEIKRLKAFIWIACIIWCIVFTYFDSFDTSGFFSSTNNILIVDIIGISLIFSAFTISFPKCPRIPFLSYSCVFICCFISGIADCLLLPAVIVFFIFGDDALAFAVIICAVGSFMSLYVTVLGSRWIFDDRRTRKESQNKSL